MAQYNSGPQGNRYIIGAIDDEDAARRQYDANSTQAKKDALTDAYGRVARVIDPNAEGYVPNAGAGRGSMTPEQTAALIKELRARQ